MMLLGIFHVTWLSWEFVMRRPFPILAFMLLIAGCGGDTPKQAAVPIPDAPTGTPKPGDERSDNAIALKLIWCPPGKFAMGSPADDETRLHNEESVDVELTQGFWLGKYEVAQGEYARLMATSPWKGQENVKEGDNIAATYVSHDDAMNFCRKLTESERKAGRLGPTETYTLPTEAQWEYACRAGTTTAFSFGATDAGLEEYAWFTENAYDAGEKFAHPAGLKRPNPFGFYDMLGNAREWCVDGYQTKLPGGTDPVVVEGEGIERVVRGGSFFHAAIANRSASRDNVDPTLRASPIGFRVCRIP
jgi:sulfatase modifying factor 1